MMNQKEMSNIKLLMMTVVPSAAVTALYIGVGIFMQDLPSLALFFVIAIGTLFPFEVWMVLSANKREFGKLGLQIVFADYEKMKWWKTLLYGFVLFGFAHILIGIILSI